MEGFYKNLAIMGGFLLLYITGAGKYNRRIVRHRRAMTFTARSGETGLAFHACPGDIISAGARPYSLDAMILGLTDKHGPRHLALTGSFSSISRRPVHLPWPPHPQIPKATQARQRSPDRSVERLSICAHGVSSEVSPRQGGFLQ